MAKRMIVDNLFRWFQKSGRKSRGVLHFLPLRRFYAVLFVPLFCRPREKCGTLWKTAWLHNVDNIRRKDIKNIGYLHEILWKKMFCAKMVTKLPDLTVLTIFALSPIIQQKCVCYLLAASHKVSIIFSQELASVLIILALSPKNTTKKRMQVYSCGWDLAKCGWDLA